MPSMISSQAFISFCNSIQLTQKMLKGVSSNDIKPLIKFGLYLIGKQDEEGFSYLAYAAKNSSNANAWFWLGLCRYHGIQTQANHSIAKRCFEKAAHANHLHAIFYLGVCYFQGIGVKKDCTIATKYFHKAAARGHLEALFSLGQCYADGIGITQDPLLARSCFELAAKRKHPEAKAILERSKTQENHESLFSYAMKPK